ncbi:hypothetical protein MUK42_13367 [Musa troglodytarum]|uniref:Uncharacterized protein n=1 Tax=Musa troglodytarum TaxID=320322 RepID=A0A9E7KT12_9LILI|nr:hypothetical protein MUK42_13367 [Musa troglodytarum]
MADPKGAIIRILVLRLRILDDILGSYRRGDEGKLQFGSYLGGLSDIKEVKSLSCQEERILLHGLQHEHRCIIGIGRIGREQLRWWVTKQLQTSHMQEEIKHTKKATAASCSVVWVAKSNGPLHPLALVI